MLCEVDLQCSTYIIENIILVIHELYILIVKLYTQKRTHTKKITNNVTHSALKSD